jgi:hypothetical protein
MNTNFNISYFKAGGGNNDDLITINEMIIPKTIYGRIFPFIFERRQSLEFFNGRVPQNSRTFINVGGGVNTQDAVARTHRQTVSLVKTKRVIECCLCKCNPRS